MPVYATRDRELELLQRYDFVVGMDEVGRGALAGPVSVGVAIVDAGVGDCPPGLGDSKVLSASKREALVEPIRRWVRVSAVGHASAGEVDAWGIVGALRVAGQRALAAAFAQLGEVGGAVLDGKAFSVDKARGVVILDGSHDWLTPPVPDLFAALDEDPPLAPEWVASGYSQPPVVMQVKADLHCAVVAAASVLAKVQRDAVMQDLSDPGYGWASNKGYASAQHIEALGRLGSSEFHRRSWKLPGVAVSVQSV